MTNNSYLETGYWEIFIDDVQGELAMDKGVNAVAKIEVVEHRAYDEALSKISHLYGQLKDAEKSIEILREDNKELKREIIIGINLHAEELERSLKLKKRIELLTKALVKIRNYEHSDHADIVGWELKEIVEEALAEIK